MLWKIQGRRDFISQMRQIATAGLECEDCNSQQPRPWSACPTQNVQPSSQGEFVSADSTGHPDTQLKEEAAPSFVPEQLHCQIPLNSSEGCWAAIPLLDPTQNVQTRKC